MADRDSSIRRNAWATWLDHQLAQRGWRAADLIAASGRTLTSSQISRWLAASHGPDIDGLRTVADALSVPVLEALVAARWLNESEAGITVVQTEKPLADFSVGDLLGELGRRYDVERTVESRTALPPADDTPYRWRQSAAPDAKTQPARSNEPHRRVEH